MGTSPERDNVLYYCGAWQLEASLLRPEDDCIVHCFWSFMRATAGGHVDDDLVVDEGLTPVLKPLVPLSGRA